MILLRKIPRCEGLRPTTDTCIVYDLVQALEIEDEEGLSGVVSMDLVEGDGIFGKYDLESSHGQMKFLCFPCLTKPLSD